MAEEIAKFRFLGYKITEAHIVVDAEQTVSKQLDVSFEKTIGVNDDDQKMHLCFEAKIFDENKAMRIEIKAEGYFEFDKGLSDSDRNVFFRTSAPAILFPYIRAYIGTLSSLSGITPIVLPTLNLSDR